MSLAQVDAEHQSSLQIFGVSYGQVKIFIAFNCSEEQCDGVSFLLVA